MIYRDFQGLRLSLLGFGTMRLPTTAAGDVDTAETEALLDYAMTHSVTTTTPPGRICRTSRRRWWGGA